MTHRLDEVFRIADRVTVLRDGRKVVTCPVAETTPQALVEHIVGRSLSELFKALPAPRAQVLLSVDGLVTPGARAGPVSGCSRARSLGCGLARRRPSRRRAMPRW